ncbi:MAG: hypothetical protein QM677_02680 [Microbacterium sp.]
MGRRTGDETRALLLRVGMQMLLERGATAGVQHIRLQEVLRRAGLTTGAAYRLWADQSDYQRDLAVAMVRLRLSNPADHLRSRLDELLAADVSGDEIIRAIGDAHVHMSRADFEDPAEALDARQFQIALTLRATARTWPELADASRRRHVESIAAFAELYAHLMEEYGMRMRSPLTVTDFAEAVAALGEGFAVHSLEGFAHPHYDAQDDDEIPAGRWTLFALTVRALVNEFMTPAAAGAAAAGGSPGAE